MISYFPGVCDFLTGWYFQIINFYNYFLQKEIFFWLRHCLTNALCCNRVANTSSNNVQERVAYVYHNCKVDLLTVKACRLDQNRLYKNNILRILRQEEFKWTPQRLMLSLKVECFIKSLDFGCKFALSERFERFNFLVHRYNASLCVVSAISS